MCVLKTLLEIMHNECVYETDLPLLSHRLFVKKRIHLFVIVWLQLVNDGYFYCDLRVCMHTIIL